ncbi:hypothetical protein E4U41_004613, partial [Claviceps citrina]
MAVTTTVTTPVTTGPSEYTHDVFARNKDFWNNYLEGRPAAPASFFERLFRYHEEHGG